MKWLNHRVRGDAVSLRRFGSECKVRRIACELHRRSASANECRCGSGNEAAFRVRTDAPQSLGPSRRPNRSPCRCQEPQRPSRGSPLLRRASSASLWVYGSAFGPQCRPPSSGFTKKRCVALVDIQTSSVHPYHQSLYVNHTLSLDGRHSWSRDQKCLSHGLRPESAPLLRILGPLCKPHKIIKILRS